MKSIYSLALMVATGAMLVTSAPLYAAGSDVLHLNFTTAFSGSNSSGTVDWSVNRQGNTENQQIEISLANLDANSTYALTAFIGDETNSTSVTSFTTDQKGAFTVKYVKINQSQTFPDALNPLCNVRELDIVNADTNTVMVADLTNPDKGQYYVKRSMINTMFTPKAVGDLLIHSTPGFTLFRLQASRLTPNTDYWLTINGNIVQTNRSDKNGRLMLKTLPAASPDVLDIQTITLTASAGTNVVLISAGLGVPCYDMGSQGAAFLGGADNFAVLAGSTVANTGPTIVNGDLGVSAGSAVTGFPPGTVNGNLHAADSTAAQAQLDLTVAYNDAAGRTTAPVSVAGNIGGMTLPPGLYKSTGSLEISSGNLTLDAKGDANAVWIFQIASTLTTTAGRQVILSGGAKAANVYWQVGTSATLGTTTIFKGTIMADQAVTLQTGATLDGRALARIAAVTLDSNIVTIPAP